MTAAFESRLTELEIKITHQDEVIEALNQVVIELRRQLDDASRRLHRVESQFVQGVPDEPGDEPPPHY